MSTLSAVLVIAGGTAIAASVPKNSVRSKSVKDNSLRGKDVRADTLTGADVLENSLDIPQQALPTNLPPSGPAGGGLAGDYPNPLLAPNSVGADQIGESAVGSGEVAQGAVTGADVADGSIGGADVDESTLAQVPSAAIGGIGRDFHTDADCDPDTPTFETCATVNLTLPANARVLLIASTNVHREAPEPDGEGRCQLRSATSGMISGTDVTTYNEGVIEHSSITGVTPVLAAGIRTFTMECNQLAGGIFYRDRHLTAVALSPN